MKRVEIVANQVLQEDIFSKFKEAGVGSHFTKLTRVEGRGSSNPKQGDHIWPEENVLLILYCSDEEAAKIVTLVKEVKEMFPNEGITLFEVEAEKRV